MVARLTALRRPPDPVILSRHEDDGALNGIEVIDGIEEAGIQYYYYTELEALEAVAERHHHLWASDGSDGGGGAGERSGRQRRGPRGDLRALPRLNGLYRLH